MSSEEGSIRRGKATFERKVNGGLLQEKRVRRGRGAEGEENAALRQIPIKDNTAEIKSKDERSSSRKKVKKTVKGWEGRQKKLGSELET